ncbi:MAG: DUF5671 domain-containing protein [Candidatus Binataceae bacterium]|jgi:hypothetical protein
MANQINQSAAGEPAANSFKSSPRDVFMYLLVILMLYAAVTEFLILAFDYINLLLPDPLDRNYYSFSRPHDSIRFAIATLCVVFPVYLWGSRFLNRDMAANPDKREAKVRRWMIYLTLFLAGLIIVGDLVSLIYNFLGGDLTARFILKAATILLVAGLIFRYYLYELHRDPAALPAVMRAIALGATVVVAALVIIGFAVAGSPERSRLERYDRQRVSDLGKLQEKIVDYRAKKKQLPASLDLLNDAISGFTPPRDPSSNSPYEYRATGPLSFELCANFSLPSGSEEPATWIPPYGIPGSNWKHAASHVCFARSIDPQLHG